jgi:molecular chaperone GrpE (heat shock protein)
MRLEPKECRLHALTCERLAQKSTSPIAKAAYADLAEKWLKVADDLQGVINARAAPTRKQEMRRGAPALG